MDTDILLSSLGYLHQTSPWVLPIVMLLFKGSLVMLVGLVLLHELRHSSAAHRHLLCAISLTAVTLLPLASLVAPNYSLAVLPVFTTFEPTNPSEYLRPNVHQISWGGLLAILYLGVCMLILTKRIRQWLKVRQMIRIAQTLPDHHPLHTILAEYQAELAITRPISILTHSTCLTPYTVGIRKPTVIWPAQAEQWSQQKQRNAIAHELAHIKRHDWLWLTLGHLACIMFWCIPLVWLLARRLRNEAEQAADNIVINLGTDRTEYADQLFRLARHAQQEKMAIHLVQPSQIYLRIAALLDIQQIRHPATTASRWGLSGVFLIVTSAVSAIQLTPAPHTNPMFTGQIHGNLRLVKLAKPEPATAQLSLSATSIRPLTRQELTTAVLTTNPDTSAQLSAAFELTNFSSRPQPPTIQTSLADHTQPQRPQIQTTHYEPHQTLRSVTPVYPKRAIEKNIEGHVVVEFSINPQGIPENIIIVESHPSKVFNRSVINALRQSRYVPYKVNGTPITLERATDTIHFKLISPEQAKKPGPEASLSRLDTR